MLRDAVKGLTGANGNICRGNTLAPRRQVAVGASCAGGACGTYEQEGVAVGRPAVSPHATQGGITGANGTFAKVNPPPLHSADALGYGAPPHVSEAQLGPSLYRSFEALSVALLALWSVDPASSVRYPMRPDASLSP